MYSKNKVLLLILLFHFVICHLGAPENWPESKVLHIKQNRLILLPARSINMQECGFWRPVTINFCCVLRLSFFTLMLLKQSNGQCMAHIRLGSNEKRCLGRRTGVQKMQR